MRCSCNNLFCVQVFLSVFLENKAFCPIYCRPLPVLCCNGAQNEALSSCEALNTVVYGPTPPSFPFSPGRKLFFPLSLKNSLEKEGGASRKKKVFPILLVESAKRGGGFLFLCLPRARKGGIFERGWMERMPLVSPENKRAKVLGKFESK